MEKVLLLRVAYARAGHNEALDLAVNALAGLYILRTDIAPSIYADLCGSRKHPLSRIHAAIHS